MSASPCSLVLSAVLPALLSALPAAEPAVAAGAPGGPGLALRAAKVLTAELEGPGFVNDGVVLVRDGAIEAVGPGDGLEIPDGYVVEDLGDRWLMPGMVDLHSHVGDGYAFGDLNGRVYQTNPGLRISSAVIPGNRALEVGVAGGVTTVLFIPGSGSNSGGQGVLLKTAAERYEDMRVRDPGSLKIAQGDNPTRWGYTMGRALMNFHLRDMLRRGRAYARAWAASERGDRPRPERQLQHEVFRHLFAGETQVSAHTQIYQLVLMTVLMFKGEFGLDVYIDHGTFDGFQAAEVAEEMGVMAMIGPRSISRPGSNRVRNDHEGAIQGVAQGYQSRGHSRIGFNTDSPIVPQEELFLQSAMGVRYGFDNRAMDAVRGLTIVPALAAGIADRVGSLEPGKDADLLVVTGDPSDPRTSVERVYLEGRNVYDAQGGRRF